MENTEMLFALSARSPGALRENAGRLARWLTADGARVPLADVAHTLAVRRAHLAERLVVRATDRAVLAALLETVADGGEPGPLAVRGSLSDTRPASPVFVFSGHGSQWDGMGAELLSREPAFAAVIDALEGVVREESGHDLRTLITRDGLAGSGMDQVQPAVYALQVGLAAVFRERGVLPAAVIGHSMGEIAAAVVSGALTPEDGARIVCRRSLLMERRLAGTGATALVELDAAEARRRLTGRPGISVAVHSSPRACVVAGLPDAVEAFVAECRAEGLLARLVPGVRIGAHSPLVDPLLGELTAALGDIEPGTPRVAYYSCTSEDPRERPALDAGYWAANLRRPVRLTEAVRAAAEDGLRVFMEVSPHPVVAQSVLETVLKTDGAHRGRSTVLGTLGRGAPTGASLAGALATLHCAGVTLPRQSVPAGRPAELPAYAWQHQSFPRPRRAPVDSPAHPLLGHRITLPGTPVRHVWQSRVGADRLPWLDDHRVQGTPVLPGTAYAELALACACEAFGAGPDRVEVSGLDLARVLPLDRPATLTTTLEEDPEGDGGTVTVVAGTGAGSTGAVLARARVALVAARAPGLVREEREEPHDGGDGGDGTPHDPRELYAALRALGQEHGPAFAGVTGVRVGGGFAVSRVARPAVLAADGRWRFHPALLDACLHGLGSLMPEGTRGTYLPTGVERLRVTGTPGDVLVCRARLRPGLAGTLSADVEITDPGGAPVARLTGVRLSPVGEEALPVDVAPLLRHVRWETAPGPDSSPDSGPGTERRRLLVSGDPDGTVTAALSAAGVTCARVGPDGPWDAAGQVDGVVLTAWAGPDPDPSPDVPGSAEERVHSALRLVSGLLRRYEDTGTPPPPLTVLTVRAQPVREGEEPDPGQAALRAVVRTLRQERPELRARIVDLDGTGAPPVAEILDLDGPDEVAWRDGRRHVARLVAGAPPAGRAGHPGQAADGGGRGRVVVRPGGGYLVTGGTRGLGLATARWLAEGGAGAVVLGGRGALGPEAALELERIRALGTRVELVTGDVAAPGTAARMADVLAAAGVRLRGVVHTAAVLEDALVTEPDGGRLHRVWSPKATGAWRLHEATERAELDWWIGFSSLASLVGSAGQAEYAAANAFLDSVVALRRARGMTALAVNWGPWEEIGAVRGRTVPGLGKLTPREGFAALEALLAGDAAHAGVARLTGSAFVEAYPQTRTSSFLSALAEAAGPGSAAKSGFDGAALAALPDGARRAAVRARTLLSVGRVLGFTDPGRIADRPLVHLGLDSLAAVRIKNALFEDFAVDVPVARLLQGASAADLAVLVTDALVGGSEGADSIERTAGGSVGEAGGAGGAVGAGGARPGAAPGAVRDATRRAAARTALAGAGRTRRRDARDVREVRDIRDARRSGS
ncbi:type I polyketide synthase [Streptomyces sp. NBC_00347]|uniref:type I polyketide synthase n=1 Tax=Streptomyces sp. NBC_00347 TaxID=2975721 RepID=UPI002256D703|nr:type I polyketide synthase [Streptomyces sp. NBC_00347]MCX5127240.1 type I polyketide synthase [Streptomyces sp. NBC_00347]